MKMDFENLLFDVGVLTLYCIVAPFDTFKISYFQKYSKLNLIFFNVVKK